MLALTASDSTVLSYCWVLTIASLDGQEILVLGAGSPDDPLVLARGTAVVGFMSDGFVELRRQGSDLIVRHDEDGDAPDTVVSVDGGIFRLTARLTVIR